MGNRSLKSLQQERNKNKSAYNYLGNYVFYKGICIKPKKRLVGKKMKPCKKWKYVYLDLKKPADAAVVKAAFILMPEGEL